MKNYFCFAQTEGSKLYETRRLVDQYIALHYCPPEEYMSYDFGPQDALDFPRRCVELCLQYKPVSWEGWTPDKCVHWEACVALTGLHCVSFRTKSSVELLTLAAPWGDRPLNLPGSMMKL